MQDCLRFNNNPILEFYLCLLGHSTLPLRIPYSSVSLVCLGCFTSVSGTRLWRNARERRRHSALDFATIHAATKPPKPNIL